MEEKVEGKESKIATKEGERPTCTHCQRVGHDESKCWKLQPELKPKKFLKKKGEKKANAAIQQGLGFNFGDKRKITTMALIGNPSEASSSSTFSSSSFKSNEVIEYKKRIELFHIRINIQTN